MAATEDAGAAAPMSPSTDEDCFNENCWPYPWGDFEPEFTAVTPDAGIDYVITADTSYSDGSLTDAAPADGQPQDAGCAAQREPPCPQPPPGDYLPQNPGIPGGGQCRGACGKGCPATCRAGTPTTACLEWQTADCQWHAKVCTYPVLECGSAVGCRTHDSCYDQCALALVPSLCRRTCDVSCIRRYGVTQCNEWRKGKGPYDVWLQYTGRPTTYTYDSTRY